jgi:hypothetical protein
VLEEGKYKKIVEAEYSGIIMYSYVKIEKWNILKLFQDGGEKGKENNGGWIQQQWYIVITFISITMYPQ